jgi:hypothetical protein
LLSDLAVKMVSKTSSMSTFAALAALVTIADVFDPALEYCPWYFAGGLVLDLEPDEY